MDLICECKRRSRSLGEAGGKGDINRQRPAGSGGETANHFAVSSLLRTAVAACHLFFRLAEYARGWHPNSRDATVLYRQEERLKVLGELDSLIRLEMIHDPKVAKEMQQIRFGADFLSR